MTKSSLTLVCLKTTSVLHWDEVLEKQSVWDCLTLDWDSWWWRYVVHNHSRQTLGSTTHHLSSHLLSLLRIDTTVIFDCLKYIFQSYLKLSTSCSDWSSCSTCHYRLQWPSLRILVFIVGISLLGQRMFERLLRVTNWRVKMYLLSSSGLPFSSLTTS